jgi:hypothetical protein
MMRLFSTAVEPFWSKERTRLFGVSARKKLPAAFKRLIEAILSKGFV